MTKFKIPIDYDALKEDLPDEYFNGTNFVHGPVIGIEGELEFVCTASGPGALGDVRRLEEYITKDLNSVVMNLSSSQSMSPHSYMTFGGGGHVAGPPSDMRVSMKVILDPLINDPQGFARLLEQEGPRLNMMLVRWSFSTVDRDVLYGQGEYKSKPTVRYKPTKIECCECHEEFLHTDLKDDEALWGEGGLEKTVSSDTVCPKCGAWDCCELEFEQLPR